MGHDSDISFEAQLGVRSLKISSHFNHTYRNRGGQVDQIRSKIEQ